MNETSTNPKSGNKFKDLQIHSAENAHTASAPLELFNSTLWPKEVEILKNKWIKFHKKYMNTPKHIDLQVIFYEDLRDDLRLTVQKVIKFLHEVNGNRFIQSEEEINQRLDCLIEVSKTKVSNLD